MNARTLSGDTPLMQFCKSKSDDVSTAKFLLSHGAQPLLKNREGDTAQTILDRHHALGSFDVAQFRTDVKKRLKDRREDYFKAVCDPTLLESEVPPILVTSPHFTGVYVRVCACVRVYACMRVCVYL